MALRVLLLKLAHKIRHLNKDSAGFVCKVMQSYSVKGTNVCDF
jgi:hypothetical protein